MSKYYAMTIKKWFTHPLLSGLLSLIAGALLPLAFAPFHIFPLAIVCLAVLLGLWCQSNSARRAAWLGLLFGVACFSVGTSWIFISLQQFGGIAPIYSSLLTALFVFILSLYSCFSGYFLVRFFPENAAWKCFLAFPAIWILFAWIRSWFFNGFPWLQLGYSQVYSPLKGYAPLLSVYGVSLAVLWSAALIVYAVLGKKRRWVPCLVAFVALWAIGGILSFIPWTHATGKPVTVSLLQGNIPQSIKWSPGHIDLSIKRYTTFTENNWHSQLIVWPETAIPLPYRDIKPLLTKLGQAAHQHGSSLIVGVPIKADRGQGYYNGLLVFGNGEGRYLKRRLVLFGESLPNVTFLEDIYRYFHIPKPGIIAGPLTQPPVKAQRLRIAPFICYEIVFPEQVRRFTENNNILLTISDDAWFGHSIALAQHLQMAQMRAIETGRYVMFDSNSGITAIISPEGHLLKTIPPFKAGVLHGTVQAMQGQTPWLRWGLSPLLIAMLLFLLISIKFRLKLQEKLREK